LVSDGRATAGPPGIEPLQAAIEAAGVVRRRGVASLVVDAEEGPTRLGLAAELASAMGARHLRLEQLSDTALAAAVQTSLA
jgi:magnesium chelatase subunit D